MTLSPADLRRLADAVDELHALRLSADELRRRADDLERAGRCPYCGEHGAPAPWSTFNLCPSGHYYPASTVTGT